MCRCWALWSVVALSWVCVGAIRVEFFDHTSLVDRTEITSAIEGIALEEFNASAGPDGLHKVDHYWDSTELQWCPEGGCVLPDFYLSDFYDYSSVLDASDDDEEREELLAPITIRVTHQKEHNGEWVQLDDVSSTCSTDQSVETSFLQINVTGTVLGESFADCFVEQPREVIAAHQNYVRMMYRCKKRHHSLVEVEFKYRRSTPIPDREDGVKDENDKWVYTASVAWTKYCLGSALEHRPSLSVNETTTRRRVAQEGAAVDEFRPALSDDELFTYSSGVHMAKFSVFIEKESKGEQYLQPFSINPSVTKHISIYATGSQSQDFLATYGENWYNFELHFMCLPNVTGTHRIELTFEVPLYLPLRFAFMKECNASVAMTPLPVNIGTSLESLTDIMENDIVCDDWNADPTVSTMVVGRSVYSSTFYLSLSESGLQQQFIPVSVTPFGPDVLHRITTSTGGPGADGGVISDTPVSFTVYYHCHRQTKAFIKVSIHLPWAQELLEFGFTKKCSVVRFEHDLPLTTWTANKALWAFVFGIFLVTGGCVYYARKRRINLSLPEGI